MRSATAWWEGLTYRSSHSGPTGQQHPVILDGTIFAVEQDQALTVGVALAAWQSLVWDDQLAIRASAYHLADMQRGIHPNTTSLNSQELLAVGYVSGLGDAVTAGQARALNSIERHTSTASR